MSIPDKYPGIKKTMQAYKKANIKEYSYLRFTPTAKMKVLTMPSVTFTCYRNCFKSFNWRAIYAFENNWHIYKKMVAMIERRHYNLIAMHQDITTANPLRTINPDIVDLDLCGC